MLLCPIKANESWVVGTPITYGTPTASTNSNVSINGNGIVFNTVGWYRVRLQAVVDATGTSVGAEFVADGVAVPLSEVTVTTVAQADTEIYIEYPIHIESAPASSSATLQIVPTGAGTSINGFVFVDKME